VLASHCSCRTALGLLIAGQRGETCPVLRFCLDAAYDGFYIGDDNTRMEKGSRRNETPPSDSKYPLGIRLRRGLWFTQALPTIELASPAAPSWNQLLRWLRELASVRQGVAA